MPSDLRERRKRQTRESLAAVATAAFFERGFDQVTIAELAARAGVSKMTVTNYFPLKEDLVFDRAPDIVVRLAEAVADRDPGETVVGALRRSLEEGLAADDPTMGHLGPPFSELVDGSGALRSREREMFAEREARLAAVLAAEWGGDLVPRYGARVLAGVFDAVYFEGRRRMLAGDPGGGALGTLLADQAAVAFTMAARCLGELDRAR